MYMKESRQEEIFKEWIGEYKLLILKVVHAYAERQADKEDLFQEISIQLWKAIPGFRKEATASTFLYRVALNTAMTWSKREKRHHGEDLEASSEFLKAESVERDERLDWLYTQIHDMGDIDKPLCLLMLEGYSYREISNIIGISESNVGVRIHRIKQHLISQSKKALPYGI